MGKGNLSPQIAMRILDHVRGNRFKRGQHLPSQELADSFHVSRAPVTSALRLLEEMQIVRSERHRGFYLMRDADELQSFTLPPHDEENQEEETYFTIAEDRLSGRLPQRVTENELIRLYGLPRGRIVKVLHRIAREGWIDRRPGHGWEFRDTLTSDSYEKGYRFRCVLEGAAVLEPTFAVDPSAFSAARARQQALLDGELLRLSRAQLFQINTEFHEMIVVCSHNDFFIDAVRRVNRLRRLMEYRLTVDRGRLTGQCKEHIEILDRLESGNMADAAAFLRKHIDRAREIKTGGLG